MGIRALHPVPLASLRWGYDHLPDVFLRPDPQWEEVTATGSVEAGLLRLVTNRDVRNGVALYHRGPDSYITLDTYSLGIAHWWSDTAPALLAEIARASPDLARHAWGAEAATSLLDPRWLLRHVPAARGKKRHDPRLDWLVAGWYEVARHPDVVRIQSTYWLKAYGQPAIERAIRWRFKSAAAVAAIARMLNSGGADRYIERAREELGRGASELAIVERAMTSPSLYDKPERWEAIRNSPEFAGAAPRRLDPSTLRFEARVARVDGTRPTWAHASPLPSATAAPPAPPASLSPAGPVSRRVPLPRAAVDDAVRYNNKHAFAVLPLLCRLWKLPIPVVGWDAELVDRVASAQRDVLGFPAAGVDGKFGPQTEAGFDDSDALLAVAIAPSAWPGAEIGLDAQHAHWRAVVVALDKDCPVDEPVLLAIRGVTPNAMWSHATRIRKGYDDTLVLLEPGATPRVTVFPGATYPLQKAYGANDVPDLDGDRAADVAMIRPGLYRLEPRPRGYRGAPAMSVRTLDGRDEIPCWRNTTADDVLTRQERWNAERIQPRTGSLHDASRQVRAGVGAYATSILVHPGFDTRVSSGERSFSSIGCQTSSLRHVTDIVAAAPTRYLLVDAGQFRDALDAVTT